MAMIVSGITIVIYQKYGLEISQKDRSKIIKLDKY